MRVSQIQDQIGRGVYRVDTQAVADAIIRWLIALDAAAVPPPQSECS